jgi:hypothetical protein
MFRHKPSIFRPPIYPTNKDNLILMNLHLIRTHYGISDAVARREEDVEAVIQHSKGRNNFLL